MHVHTRRAALFYSAVASACLLGSAQAQTPPDAGQLLRDAQRQKQAPQPPEAAASNPTGAPPRQDNGPRVAVKGFRLHGVHLLPEAQLQAELQTLAGQSLSFAELRRATDIVARQYQAAGYLVRVYLPEQTLTDGVVTIAVLEGRLSTIKVEQEPPGRHISKQRVERMMTARQQLGAPVRADDVQRAVSLLNALPGMSASSLLEPGEQAGDTALVVSVKDEAALNGQVQVDNAGSRATGEWRASAGLSWNSPLGVGDQVLLFASKSSGSAYGSAGYSAPLGNDGLRTSLNASRLTYAYELSGSRYNGSAADLGAQLSYPVLRSQGANLGTFVSYDHKRFDNAVAGVRLNDKTIKLAGLGLLGDLSDELLGGGVTQWSLTLNWGRLDLSGEATDLAADQAANGPNRQGRFKKLSYSLGRIQRLTRRDSLLVNLTGQSSNRNLDSAEKLSVTGSTGVRAYSSAEPSGDDATLLGLEWRHQLSELLSLSLFRDQARVKRDHTPSAATLSPNAYTVAGNGVGFSWGKASTVLIRGALSWRAGSNPARNIATGEDSDGTRRDPRLFISLLKVF